jgi:hypothetical protein
MFPPPHNKHMQRAGMDKVLGRGRLSVCVYARFAPRVVGFDTLI